MVEPVFAARKRLSQRKSLLDPICDWFLAFLQLRRVVYGKYHPSRPGERKVTYGTQLSSNLRALGTITSAYASTNSYQICDMPVGPLKKTIAIF